MNIGLLDVDSHHFPNLALMKLSAYHKKKGDNVEFATMFGNYDVVYKSKIFSWTADDEYCLPTAKMIEGGIGYNFAVLEKNIEYMCPDYELYNCKHAYGFLTRGCPNKCNWCIVPKKEGKISAHDDIENFIENKKSVILLDNNVLASKHGIEQIKKMINLKIKIDFNQGLDSRLIDKSMAKLLSKLKWLKPLRMACDSQDQMKYIKKATKLLRENNCTPKNYFIYVLVKDIDDAKERVNFLKNLNLDPFAQAYRDLKNNKITYVQKKFCRWVNHKAIFKTVKWENYK